MSDRESRNVASIAVWKIQVGGTDLAMTIMDALISAEVDSSLEVPDMAVLRFHDPNLELVDGTTFDLGKPLKIAAIERNAPKEPALFDGEIVAIEPNFSDDANAVLTVRAYDKRHRLTRETKTRKFVQVTDSDIVTQVVGGSGLTAEASATSQVRDVVFQQNQNDLEFLVELAQRNSFEISIDGTKLVFGEANTSSVATLQWGTTLRSFSPRLSVAGQVNEVVVRGWEGKDAKAIVGTASSSKSAPAIGFGKSGGEAAQSAFSAAKRFEVHHVLYTQDEAKSIAQRILDDINSEFVQADGVANGNALIRAGKVVTIERVGSKFSGTYHVTSATHVLDHEDGYQVYFHIAGARPQLISNLASSPATIPVSAGPGYVGAAVAIVTNNKDENDLGRVKVKFPWYDDTVESWWARIAMPGAGANRGFFVLPEVGDEVLVVFEHGDMNRPYVLGGLYSNNAKPPITSSEAVDGSGKVVDRIFKTTAGHVIDLKEKSGGESITIADGKSKVSVEMDSTNQKMNLKSQGEYSLEAQGKVTIKSASATVEITGTGDVKIKSNANVSVEAAAQMTLKGSVVTVESSGPLTLKGNPVQIN